MFGGVTLGRRATLGTGRILAGLQQSVRATQIQDGGVARGVSRFSTLRLLGKSTLTFIGTVLHDVASFHLKYLPAWTSFAPMTD